MSETQTIDLAKELIEVAKVIKEFTGSDQQVCLSMAMQIHNMRAIRTAAQDR